ncbi:succinate semialdehyde dehydrogenase [Armillaria fumosa]|nr:succinate semialdehyde dehydrogenase [Armillaria fumosa]
MSVQTTIIPHSQQPLVTRTYPSEQELDGFITIASKAQKTWNKVPLKERIAIGYKFIDEFKALSEDLPMELTLQMGRPVSQCAGEARGFLDRANYMLSIAESALADVSLADTDKPGFRRYIKRTPLGVVLVVAPWNFPYLVSINAVLPAIIAGNAVILKPSPQTPLTAERFALSLTRAGVPKDIIQVVHMSPALTSHAVQHPSVDFVSFTGSVVGGRAVEEAAVQAKGFKGVGLELGGKDPAYVRPDADLNYTIGELVDGALFNSGQSCCAVERIYVHETVYDVFVEGYVKLVKGYKLGDPTLPETNLGPVVSLASAERIRKQVLLHLSLSSDLLSVKAGAKTLIPEDLFPMAKAFCSGTTYVAPQVLVDVNHSMDVMMEETFGPIVGIQRVSSDEEAIKLMNDSPYGLTASIWTNATANPTSEEAFLKFVDELETGTVFLNRCDFLDPALAWTGVKDSGRGVSLSKFGYDQLTRAKSVHMKIKTS